MSQSKETKMMSELTSFKRDILKIGMRMMFEYTGLKKELLMGTVSKSSPWQENSIHALVKGNRGDV